MKKWGRFIQPPPRSRQECFFEMEAGDVLGHEFMGIVEEVGKDVTNLRRGDKVVVPLYNCLRQLSLL
jgi:threonine dehydrogenase-like Zn-dependent dehydrogenase